MRNVQLFTSDGCTRKLRLFIVTVVTVLNSRVKSRPKRRKHACTNRSDRRQNTVKKPLLRSIRFLVMGADSACDFRCSICKKDGPAYAVRLRKIRQILAQNATTRPIGLSNRKMASVFNKKTQLSRAGLVCTAAAVRGTHKSTSTSSDRCVGL